MIEPSVTTLDEIQLTREERVIEIQNLIETLRIADEISNRGT